MGTEGKAYTEEILSFYFRNVFLAAGLTWDSDNDAEIHEAVDALFYDVLAKAGQHAHPVADHDHDEPTPEWKDAAISGRLRPLSPSARADRHFDATRAAEGLLRADMEWLRDNGRHSASCPDSCAPCFARNSLERAGRGPADESSNDVRDQARRRLQADNLRFAPEILKRGQVCLTCGKWADRCECVDGPKTAPDESSDNELAGSTPASGRGSSDKWPRGAAKGEVAPPQPSSVDASDGLRWCGKCGVQFIGKPAACAVHGTSFAQDKPLPGASPFPPAPDVTDGPVGWIGQPFDKAEWVFVRAENVGTADMAKIGFKPVYLSPSGTADAETNDLMAVAYEQGREDQRANIGKTWTYFRCRRCGRVEAPCEVEPGDVGTPQANCGCYMGPDWEPVVVGARVAPSATADEVEDVIADALVYSDPAEKLVFRWSDDRHVLKAREVHSATREIRLALEAKGFLPASSNGADS